MQRTLCLLPLIIMACGNLAEQGSPPRLDPIGKRSALVGEKLTLVITATDPDGDDLSFSIDGRPPSAQFVALDDGKSALFTWLPEVTESEPGGKDHEVTFYVEDDTGAWDSEDVIITVVPQWAPAFLNPPGYVLNLAETNSIEFMVEVKDDSASHVDISIVSGPNNAYLEKADKKKAYFSWRPTDEQVKTKLFWYVRFSATGYTPDPAFPGQETQLYQLTHDIVIVITNADFEGCPGSPPSITHSAFADYHWDPLQDKTGYPLEATVNDWDSYVDHVNLFWTSAHDPATASFLLSSLSNQGGDNFGGFIPKVQAGSGSFVHYYLEAWDNDDYAGTNCDHVTRLPKTGYFTFVAYDQGYDSSCMDDVNEDNDTLAAATPLTPGAHPGQRLCGDDHDYYSLNVFSPEAAVSVTAQGNPDSLVMEAMNQTGSLVATATTGSSSISVPGGLLTNNVLNLHFYSQSGEPVTYAINVEEKTEQCSPDDLEPNNSTAQAPLVGEGEFGPLSICPGDEDYFRLEIPSGTVLSVLVDFLVDSGDLDLFLVGSDGQTVIAWSDTSTDDEELEFNILGGGTHYLLVKGLEGSSNNYNLTIAFGAQSQECVEDSFSPNHYADEAIMTPASSYNQLVACPGKEDWFALGLNGGESLTASVTSTSGALQLNLTDNAGTLLCMGNPAGSTVSMTCPIPAPGDYKYSISNQTALAVNYDLQVSLTEDTSFCLEDRFEENDQPAEGAKLVHNVTTRVKSCGLDKDWFSFSGYPMEHIYLALSYDKNLGFIDIYLYDKEGNIMLAQSDGYAGAPILEATLQNMADYSVLVMGQEAGTNIPYDLLLFIQ